MADSLKKTLGFSSLVMLGAAGVIGSGWIYTTSDFFREYGAGGVVLGMLLASLLAACIALAYAELASQFPRAGGEILYTFLAYNRTLSFVIGWLLIGAFVSNTAFYMAAFGSLLTKGIPALKPVLENVPLYNIAGSQVYLWSLLAGIVLVLFFYMLNKKSVDVGASAQKFLFSIKVLLGISLTVAGIALGAWANFWPAFPAGSGSTVVADAQSVMRFVIPALTFLTGFSLVSLLAEEADLSPRRIGVAVVLTIFLAGGYYCLVLLGTAMMIPWQESAQMEFGAISTFTHAGYPVLGYAAMGIAFLGMATGSLGMAMGCSRIIFAMGRGGLLPQWMGRVNKNGVPANALTVTLLMTLAFGWLGRGAMIWFLDTGGVYVGLSWVLTVFCMYRIRKLYPNNPRPYRVRVGWLPFAGALGALGIIVMTLVPNTSMSLKPEEYYILLLWVVLGLGLYAGYTKKSPLSAEESLKNMLGDGYAEVKKLQDDK